MPAPQYVHPEFGFLCPTPRFRRRLRVALACLAVAGAGAVVLAAADGPKLDAVITRIDVASVAVTSPATSGPRLALVEGAQTAADKPSCVGSEGNCVSVKLRKPRMVRVATDRPAIAAVALGRSAAPTISANDAALPAVGTGRQGELAKSDQAAPNMVAAADSTEPSKKAVAKPKKAQKSAHAQNYRRDQYSYGAPSWREVRVDDWAGRSTPQGSETTRGADTVAGALRPISGKAGW